jgi:hypothetical protein
MSQSPRSVVSGITEQHLEEIELDVDNTPMDMVVDRYVDMWGMYGYYGEFCADVQQVDMTYIGSIPTLEQLRAVKAGDVLRLYHKAGDAQSTFPHHAIALRVIDEAGDILVATTEDVPDDDSGPPMEIRMVSWNHIFDVWPKEEAGWNLADVAFLLGGPPDLFG